MTHDLPTELLSTTHAAGLDFVDYVATDPTRAPDWLAIHEQVTLTPSQRTLIEGFVRRLNVVVVSGTWCGDCVQQGPLLARIAEASNRIDLRWVDRDEHPALASSLRINGGDRVPVAVFMNEFFEPVSILGDRTLTRYRAIAARNLGPSCPRPGAPVPTEELVGTLQEWLDEFERVQLLLRLSPRLRAHHGD
ncbi:MAG: thiol reductase thioredoxin [Phycisphaeraceae bacterium]|nr:thiol reductase thioredoxin [Phycisphaeraceae bacterium]MCP4496972.1 thiol reductase thioredoxin [Phycisphaeraceae bacterium]MCP4796686.1 thiol reductase thioredoxin [Phycisphaeraceae bacterium]MCP4938617.1 thiol reductase thioredoxin [Phycisphaeraceae bacterium]HAC09492.1 thiol reductase thioredoxin [Phycisphaerales bacterium]